MTLYDKVKELATEKDLSIAALEIKSGIANGTIAGWKTGRPYADTLGKVATALETTIDELMEGIA